MSMEEKRAELESMARERHVPFSAHLDLTMACNHTCRHCYRVLEERPELTTGEWLRVLDELHGLGSFFLTFSGGEISLREDLWEILQRARELKFSARLKTNAYGCVAGAARRLRDRGVSYVDESLYGATADPHDEVTGVPGSWQRTCKNITRMTKAGLRVNVNMALINSNFDEATSMKALVDSLGASSLGINHQIFPGTDGGTGPLQCALEPEMAAKVLRKVYPPESMPKTTTKDPDSRFCSAGHSLVYVNPYGDVSPCVTFPMVCGSIKEQSLEEIWYGSETLKTLREARYRDLGAEPGSEITKTHCPGAAFIIHKDYLASE